MIISGAPKAEATQIANNPLDRSKIAVIIAGPRPRRCLTLVAPAFFVPRSLMSMPLRILPKIKAGEIEPKR